MKEMTILHTTKRRKDTRAYTRDKNMRRKIKAAP